MKSIHNIVEKRRDNNFNVKHIRYEVRGGRVELNKKSGKFFWKRNEKKNWDINHQSEARTRDLSRANQSQNSFRHWWNLPYTLWEWAEPNYEQLETTNFCTLQWRNGLFVSFVRKRSLELAPQERSRNLSIFRCF